MLSSRLLKNLARVGWEPSRPTVRTVTTVTTDTTDDDDDNLLLFNLVTIIHNFKIPGGLTPQGG